MRRGQPIDIRRATSSDAAAVAEIARRTFTDTFAAANRAEDMDDYVAKHFSEALQRTEIETPGAATLLATIDGELIGYAQLQPSAAPAALERPIELARFYVAAAWHGRGVAQQLMRAVEDEARKLGAATLWLGVWEHNPRAIAFYTRSGFADIGSHSFLLGTDLQTDREMMKRL